MRFFDCLFWGGRLNIGIYGANGGLVDEGGRGLGLGGRGVWCDIVKVGSDIDEVGIDFTSSCIRRGRVVDKGRWENGVWKWEWDWVREPRRRALGDIDELLELGLDVNVKPCENNIVLYLYFAAYQYFVIFDPRSLNDSSQLEDAEGVDSLPNAIIFEELTRMGFIQVFLDNQIEGMATHDEIYIAPSNTKKIFANMRRLGKGFSGRDTPLFPTMMVQAQQEQGEGSVVPTDTHHTPTIIHPSSSQPQKKQTPRRTKKKDTQAPQPSGPTTNVVAETLGDTFAQTRFKRVSKTSNDPLGEDSLKLTELMELCTNLQQRVLDLENIKTAQAQEITGIKLRVKKLEKKGRSRTHKLKRLYKIGSRARVASDEESLGEEDASKQGRKIDDIDANEGITLVDETVVDQRRTDDEVMFKVSDLVGEEVIVAKKGVLDVATTVSTAPVKSTTIAPTPIPSKVQDKAELEEEERLAREKEEEANIALIESWDNTQAMIDVDYQLAEQLQAQEQEELTIEEKSKLFVQLLKARKKHFAALRVEERRNKPPTKAQKRNTMCTYLKNMAGYKDTQLKNKSFDDI
ncbi:hypothetical protein Tco_1236405 [Tanacetum coccineum]